MGCAEEVTVLSTYLWLSIIFQGGQGWVDWPPFYFKAQLQKIEIWEEKIQTCFGEEAATFWHWTLLLPFRPSRHSCSAHMDKVYGNICSSNISKYLPCAFQCNIINFTKLPGSVSASCLWVSKALGSDKWALVLALRRSKVPVRSGPLLCGRDKLI